MFKRVDSIPLSGHGKYGDFLFHAYTGTELRLVHDHFLPSTQPYNAIESTYWHTFNFNVRNIIYFKCTIPNWIHSARRPFTGLLYLPRVNVRMEKFVEWMVGETEVLGENLLSRHFVHHKSHLTRPGIEPGPPRWEASD
jgi:hypothetical protein